MKAIGVSGILAIAAVLAGCSEGIATTAPSASSVALAPTSFIGDRPYTWSVKCAGALTASASWSWMSVGTPIAGTQMSVTCDPTSSPSSGVGTRPAAADGFTACVNVDGVNYGTCQTWTFDPAGAFKAQLKDSDEIYDFNRCGFTWHGHQGNNCYLNATATLTVDS